MRTRWLMMRPWDGSVWESQGQWTVEEVFTIPYLKSIPVTPITAAQATQAADLDVVRHLRRNIGRKP